MRTEYDEVKDILIKNNITNIEDIEYGGDAFSDLFEYYSSDPDGMPYGVQKARTGMPDEWIHMRLCDLGFGGPLEPEFTDDDGNPISEEEQERANHMAKSISRGEM
jgi:hypothetical protein